VLYGAQFASVQSGEFEGACCSGVAPLERLGQRLVAWGANPNRKIRIEKGGIHIGEATVGAAASGDLNNNG
jgi:hypothetical protein